MRFIGNLSRNKQGAGSIIGATFLVLILLTGYTFYTLHVNLANDYTKTLEEMQQLDLKRNKENLEFISVSTISGDKLNITVKNTGSYQTHLIWLGIFNETANTQEYYNINFYINPAETVTDIRNETITIPEGQELVIQLVTEIGNTFIYSYPEELGDGGERYDFVDKTSNVDKSNDKGTHSFFSAQQAGPDGIVDTLLEGNTSGGGPEQWVSPTGHEDPQNEWSDETDAYDDDTGTYAVDDVPGGDTWSQYLVLTHSSIICGRIRYYIGREHHVFINQIEIGIYNGTWSNVYSGAGTWNAWTNVSFTETSVTKMRFRFHNTDPTQKRMAYVYEADFLQSGSSANYELDLEVQWTDVDYDETNEWLCIYGGTMGSEEILVDVWNGSAWINVFTDLSSGWNSVDVSSYLDSPTFTIRIYTETGDAIQDSWEIDATFLHVWTEGG